jgi:phosphoserine phosphatase RsbU/P
MFEVKDTTRSSATVTPPKLLPDELRVLDGVTRELRPAVWAMGVTCSAHRLTTDLTRRERELLGTVERGLGRIVHVLSCVHDLVLLERHGELPIDPVPADMSAICDYALDQLREAGIADKVLTTHEGDGEGVWDPERLSQAISFLVECAAEAAPAEAPEVRLHWRGGAREILVVVERSPCPGDTPGGIDLEWGDAPAGPGEGGLRATVARAILLSHGGSLALFASPCAVAYVARLPRDRSE